METYRSGHNGAHSKCVCPPGHEGSNPSVSAIEKSGNHAGFWIFSYIFYLVYTIPVQPLEVSVILHELVKRNRHKTVNIRLCHP